MHLIKDENGNVIPHGSDHHHDHEHGHEHCGSCNSDCQGNCTDEVVALLNYMLSQFNLQYVRTCESHVT